MATKSRYDGMTDREVLDAMQADTPMARARKALGSAVGRMEQAGQQRTPESVFDMRKGEFKAVEAILRAYGIDPEAPVPASDPVTGGVTPATTLLELLQLGLEVRFQHGARSLQGRPEQGIVDITRRGESDGTVKLSDGAAGVTAALRHMASLIRRDAEDHGLTGVDLFEADMAAAPAVGTRWREADEGVTELVAIATYEASDQPPAQGLLLDVLAPVEAGSPNEAFEHRPDGWGPEEEEDVAEPDEADEDGTPMMQDFAAVPLKLDQQPKGEFHQPAFVLAILKAEDGSLQARPLHQLLDGRFRQVHATDGSTTQTAATGNPP